MSLWWKEYIRRSSVDLTKSGHAGLSILGWKIGRYSEEKVLQVLDSPEEIARRVGQEMGEASLEVTREEIRLRHDAVRKVVNEMDLEVAKEYWGDKPNPIQIVGLWRRYDNSRGDAWGQVAPFRLPRPEDTWIWWKGQGEPGVVALAGNTGEEPVRVGPGRNVLVVTDDRRIERGLRSRGGWHRVGDELQQILLSLSGANGTLNIVNVKEFDAWLSDSARVGMLTQFSSVMVGAARDLDTPTRLAKTWCQASGWGEQWNDQVAQSWLEVVEHEKLMLDLTSLKQYWITT